MKLVSENLGLNHATDLQRQLEDTVERLREAAAIYDGIQAAALLEQVGPTVSGARQQCAISMLNVMHREILAVINQQMELVALAATRLVG